MLKGNLFELSSGNTIEPIKGQNFKETSWHKCQCSSSNQTPSQDDLNYHHFLSLYKTLWRNDRAELIIYDTESGEEEEIVLGTELGLDVSASITQLPNGELFCYGNSESGITLIIDRNYGIRMLPSGTRCGNSSALYFDNNIYCFGGCYKYTPLTLSRKFDLKNNRWINLTSLPEADENCHSVI